MLLKTAYKMKPPPSVRLKRGHPLARDLFACYLLNSASEVQAFDSSRRGHHGTISYGVLRRYGKFGRATYHTGLAGEISIPDHADFTPASTPFSIAAWIYMHDASSFVIASKGVYNTDAEWLFYSTGSNLLVFYKYDESIASCRLGRYYNSDFSAYENQWIHLAVTDDGGALSSGIRIYLNGVRIDDTTTENNAASFVAVEPRGHAVWLGRYGNEYANGLIDNVTFWRRVLTPSDVIRHYVRTFSMFDQRQRLPAGVAI